MFLTRPLKLLRGWEFVILPLSEQLTYQAPGSRPFQQMFRGQKSLVGDLFQFGYTLAHWISSLNNEIYESLWYITIKFALTHRSLNMETRVSS